MILKVLIFIIDNKKNMKKKKKNLNLTNISLSFYGEKLIIN